VSQLIPIQKTCNVSSRKEVETVTDALD